MDGDYYGIRKKRYVATMMGIGKKRGGSKRKRGGSKREIHARLSFALLRASVACLRGARRPIHCHHLVYASAALAVAEARTVI